MEWSKDRTLKLIELLQVNANLWNPSLCETRRDKQKRREELRMISELLGISVPDTTKKIQHLRTQYNRESAREARAYAEEPNDRYVSNWYAFEYLHFLKYSSKPYRLLESEENTEICVLPSHSDNAVSDCKLASLSPPPKISRIEQPPPTFKPEVSYPSISRSRDEFSVFGEYIANELRSLKGEKNLLVAKKKIQDIIFEVKMGMISEPRAEQQTLATLFANTTQPHNTTLHSSKLYSTPVMTTTAHIEPLSASHAPPTTGISEIIINGACHYSEFKVDTQ